MVFRDLVSCRTLQIAIGAGLQSRSWPRNSLFHSAWAIKTVPGPLQHSRAVGLFQNGVHSSDTIITAYLTARFVHGAR